jgi:penicillin-binding protein 1A
LQLDPADEDLSPLSVGALTYGITLENLVNAYLPYGNQGVQCDAHIISKIEQANHDVIYENNGNPRQAVSAETAWVMNRLLKNVVENGTGTGAKLDGGKVLSGKTGTTDNWYDLTFVGLTRDFVSGITIGYKYYNDALQLPTSLHSAEVWKNAIGDYAESIDSADDFDAVASVTEAPMCTVSGMIAGVNCPKGVTGYWKSTNAPVCTGNHYSSSSSSSSESTVSEGTTSETATSENGEAVTSASSETQGATSAENAGASQETEANAESAEPEPNEYGDAADSADAA